MKTTLAENILNVLKKILGDGPIGLHEPEFLGNEKEFLIDCINSTYVSSVGPYVSRFEVELQEYTGAKFAIATVNGTSALHISLVLAGVEADHEVLVPALTFIATANAVKYCGAIPHFVASEQATLGIDSRALRDYLDRTTKLVDNLCINSETGRIIKALVPMHTFGHPSDLSELSKIAEDFNLVLVEDAAESLGSFYQDKHTGTIGKIGALSFNGNKIITTGGGGAILTNDPELASRAKHLTTTAKLPHAWEFIHDEVGFNYRMPNINAAVGCAQLEQLDSRLAKKRYLFEKYQKEFKEVDGVTLFSEPGKTTSNYWLQTLILSEDNSHLRDEVLGVTNNSGFGTRPAWRLLSDLDPFTSSPQMPLDSTRALANRLINIPSNAKFAGGSK
jgi:aminotransferase in exopolysaccharide biosynthesis